MKIPAAGADGLPEGWPQDHGIPTLGPQVLAWAETTIVQPDGDRAGHPWQWREWQARYQCWWHALDNDGRHIWRRGQIVLSKGGGKSPLAGAECCCQLAGPVHFDGWDLTGEPVGRAHPSPWVQLAAVSQDQTDNTMSLVLAMLREGPAARTIPGLDCGLTRVRTRTGMLQPVTASAPSREGQRTTAAVIDEPHLWVAANGGHRLAATLRRNLAKMGGRSLETTNAWVPGENSVAELTHDYAVKVAEGRTVGDLGVLRYHPAESVLDLSDTVELRGALTRLYGDSPWVDVERLVAEIQDLGTDPQDARRFYLNEVSAATDQWITSPEWTGRYDPARTICDGDIITLGFDGSRTRAHGITDATGLVGTRVIDGHQFVIGAWEQPEGPGGKDWRVPTGAVDMAVQESFDRWRPVGFYADPAKWETYVAKWESKFGSRLKVKASRSNPIEWWMNRPTAVVAALEQYRSAVVDGEMTHDGSSAFTRHILNARRRPTRTGIQIAKEHPDSARKIDLAICATLSWQARLDALAAGLSKPPRQYAVGRLKVR